ncbi:MAG TPA: STAS domain-containing protein, partial [Dissulfurispiraceae bacterium]
MKSTVALRNEVTIEALSEISLKIKDALKICDELIVDATCVERLDAAAAQMLVAVRKECGRSGKRFVLM